MNCTDANDLFLDLVDERLEGEELSILMAHLEQCSGCRQQYEKTLTLAEALRAGSMLEIGGGLPTPTTAPVERVGDFEILNELGRGGMGVVYRARQVSLNRDVALKLLPRVSLAEATALQRFRTEAQAAAQLQHEHIVPVFSQGEADGQPFYAMELIDGRPLSAVIDERPHPAETREAFQDIARRIAEVARALHYAHENGVIHRDIKPQNLLVKADGSLHITDFGLARAIAEPGITVTGEMVGTPAYMSPEQISGNTLGPVDQRTDIYALGVTLYEVLTDHRPFEGDSREQIIAQIQHTEPATPRRFNPRIPIDLETICLRAIEKSASRRFASAADLADDLERYVQDRPIVSRRSGAFVRAGKWIRRHPALTAILVGTAITTVLASVVMIQRAQRGATVVRDTIDMLLYDNYRKTGPAREALDGARRDGAAGAEYELARGLASMRTPLDAAAHFAEARRLAPALVTPVYGAAWSSRACGDWEQYAACLRDAEALGGPLTAGDWFLYGMAIVELPQYDGKAIDAFHTAHHIRTGADHPLYTEASIQLGRAVNFWLFRHRRLDTAEQRAEFERRVHQTLGMESVVNISREYYPAYTMALNQWLLGEILAAEDSAASAEHLGRAVELARRAQHAAPQRPGGFIAEALAHEAGGDAAAALAALTRGWEVNSDPAQLVYRWRLHFWAGRLDEALSDLALAHKPGYPATWFKNFFAPLVLAERTEHDAAIETVYDGLKPNANAPWRVLLAAAALRLLREPDAARQLLIDRRSRIEWSITQHAYESSDWNKALYGFCLGESEWDEIAEQARRSAYDPELLLVQARFFAAVERLAAGDLGAAEVGLEQTLAAHDYEQYSYFAATLLTKLRGAARWPQWLGHDTARGD